MRIKCTILRKNGSVKEMFVKETEKTFTLEGHKYNIGNYYIRSLPIIKLRVLQSYYVEGFPDAIELEINSELKRLQLKVDSKAYKILTEKRILDVISEEDMTRIEKASIIVMIIVVILSVLNLIVSLTKT